MLRTLRARAKERYCHPSHRLRQLLPPFPMGPSGRSLISLREPSRATDIQWLIQKALKSIPLARRGLKLPPLTVMPLYRKRLSLFLLD